MNDARRLAAIRGIHTAIYLIMATSTFVILYAGITGARGTWLRAAMVLMGVEVAVFAGNGLKCPLTTLAVKYGAKTGHVFDTFLPERFTRYYVSSLRQPFACWSFPHCIASAVSPVRQKVPFATH